MSNTSQDLRREICAIMLQGSDDDVAVAASSERLQRLLRSSPQALWAYLEHVELMAGLGLGQATPSLIPHLTSFSPNGSSLVLPMAKQSWLQANSWYQHRWIAIAASGMLVAYFIALIVILGIGKTQQFSRDVAEVQNGHFVAGVPPIATVIEARDCVHAAGKVLLVPGMALATEPIEFTAGYATLKFRDGATVVLQGPCRFQPQESGRASLQLGKLSAYVPKQAIGFTVETPTAKIVDLGTEFVVEVDHARQTKVAVTKGAVELVSEPPIGHRVILHGQRERLVAGQAMTMTRDPSGIVSSHVAPFDAPWIRRAAELRPFLDPIAAKSEGIHPFCQAVLQTPGLVGYWRLGENGRQGARDEINLSKTNPLGRSRGIFHNFNIADFGQPGALQSDPNTAIRFNGKSSYVDCGNDPALNGPWEGVTIAAWINPAGVNPIDGATNDGMEMIGGKWDINATQDCVALFKFGDKIHIHVGDGVTPEEGLRGRGNLPLAPGRFQWVVGTWDAESRKYQLYVDAQQDDADGLQVGNGLNSHSDVPFVIGGLAYRDERKYGNRNFSGFIDEVCVFSRALSQAEIQALFETNSKVAAPK